MDTTEAWQSVLVFVRENEALIEIFLFLFAFAESIIIASAFVPSTFIFIGIGALEGAAAGPLVPLVIAGALGAFAGDLASYAIGHWLRDDIPKLWPLRNHPELIVRTRALFERWGLWAIVVSKLTGPLRPIVPMLAGASTMHTARFAAASAVSSVIWSVLVLVPAYYGVNVLMH